MQLIRKSIWHLLLIGLFLSETGLTQTVQPTQGLFEWQKGDSIVHLTGYADFGYDDSSTSNSTFSIGRFAPIFHYMYGEKFLLEGELEFELEDEGSGTETQTKLEYLAIDLFLNDYMTLVAGKFLSPIGQFRQNLHPTWINKLPSAPLGFGHGGAAPLADVGLQLRGGFHMLGKKANYAVFWSNGPTLKLDGGELEIETEGENSDGNDNKGIGGRFGLFPFDSLEIGISYAKAKAGLTGEENRDYQVVGADFTAHPDSIKNLALRGEFVKTELGAGGITASEKRTLTAGYLQASYQVDELKIEPVIRYGEFKSEAETTTTNRQTAVGVNYLFASNMIGKVAYEFNRPKESAANENFSLQLAYGF